MNKFLIVRLGALGDIVHAIPAVAALRRTFPDARIDWLVSARQHEILEFVPVIDTVIALSRADKPAGVPLRSAIRTMRRTGYDCAIDFQGLIKSALLARASGAKRVLGFSSNYMREPLGRFAYTDVYDPGVSTTFDKNDNRNIVRINLAMLSVFGIQVTAPEFPIVEGESALLNEIRATVGPRYALLNPGANWPNKRWPPERLGALAQAIKRRHALPSIVLWGPGERALAEAVVAQSSGDAVLSPQTSIRDVVALARGAAVMVSGDTGPTHIAAAVGTPIVGLYGPTRPERNGPWHPDDVTISRADQCECHHLRQCRRSRMCLLDIEVDEVAGAVERRLARRERRA